MECKSTNGRVDIMDQAQLNQFALYDKIPVEQCTSFNEALMGNFTSTDLSTAFFSKENIQIIQNGIRNGVFHKSNEQYIIGEQNCDTIKIIMRSVFLQNSVNLPNNIPSQISALNDIVVNYCVKQIYSEAQSYMQYRYDASHMYEPISRPVQVDVNDKTLLAKPWF
tara:strand:+ start:507 stop:1004 length:498 start_codon:yes stop_codon:yes gene_type:complete